MRQPLPQVFPEYRIVKHPQGAREFRVETKSYFRSQNAPASYYTGFDNVLMLIFPISGAVVWQMVCMFLARPWALPAEIISRLITGH